MPYFQLSFQVFPQNSLSSAGETSAPSASTHIILHPTAKAHHLFHSFQQGQMHQGIPEHMLRPLGYHPVQLPPNPFSKYDVGNNPFNKYEVGYKGQSPASSMSSGPPQSATTVSFSNMSADRNSQYTGRSLEQPSPLPPRPQASNSRKKCSGKSDENGATCAILGRCHCTKRRYLINRMPCNVFDILLRFIAYVYTSILRLMVLCVLYRKLRLKTTIQVRAISSKLADIPPDDYSWRKYGQKPIKGSPHPRYQTFDILMPKVAGYTLYFQSGCY